MKKTKRRKMPALNFDMRTIPVSMIETRYAETDFDRKELKTRSAYMMLNGIPVFSVNEVTEGKFVLLAAERDFFAVKFLGERTVEARVYAFTEENAEIFTLCEKLKTEKLGAMEEAYLMRRLNEEFDFTQDDISALIGKSRPAVANTLRLLTLQPEVVGLVESGKLSAGHARTLVKVPKEKQLAFAEEAIKREYTVREMERAVKAFLTPPEILQKEKEAKAQAKGEELKAFVERMRGVFRTKVTLIGNDKKGRIYIDYYSPEDLFRFEELLDMIENYK
ncbi:MAG: ParB/RepB/Spo0J family partition protein [Clostridia bacterium]|nr:ParB/RepB/Spo0J family partition protein [Clostridia bacterium]